MEVLEFSGLCVGTGCMAELDFREFLGSLHHVGLVTEGVCKDNIAAFVCKLLSCVEALVVFRNIGLDENLIILETELCLSVLKSLNEVVVIC